MTERQQIVRAAIGVFGGTILVAMLGFGYLYYLLAVSNWTLDSQMRAALGSTHGIQRIAADSATARLLKSLPKTSAVNGTDTQGLVMRGNRIDLFAAEVMVGRQSFNAYMKEDTRSFWHRIFPRWTLYKVSTGLKTKFTKSDVQS